MAYRSCGYWVMFLIVLSCAPTFAQDVQIITWDTVNRLQSAYTINFADGFIVPSKNPEHPEPFISLHEFDTGWFVINRQANRFIVFDREKTLIPVQENGLVTYFNPLAYGEALGTTTLIDAAFINNFLATLYYTQGTTYLTYDNLSLYGGWGGGVELPPDIEAKSIWGDCPADVETFLCRAWIEANLLNEQNQTVIIPMPTIGDVVQNLVPRQMNDNIPSLPYAPMKDPEAVVRIGRINPPYAVTSSLTGIVKLWNIQTSELLAEVNNKTGQPSVFGNINHTATHLAWRDNANKNLYVLDFAKGENRKVADLNGRYIQFTFLTHNADVILGVNVDFEPRVYAWNTVTGEQLDLGPYRLCNRVPDMARLSEDGSTLVIGCDTGLDIWRITND